MGISSPDDPLFITDFVFLPQECTSVNTDFDTDAQNEWVQDQMEAGLNPESFARVWAHTHPGQSASPSSTDWDTFEEAMGSMPWGIMLILGTSNEFVCVFRVQDQMMNLTVEIEPTSIPDEWTAELDNIKKKTYKTTGYTTTTKYGGYGYGSIGGGTTQKAKKRKKPILELPFWGSIDKPTWAGLNLGLKELPGKPLYASIDIWSPSFTDIMSHGPMRTLMALQKCYHNVLDDRDEGKVRQLVEKVSDVLIGEPTEFDNYDTDIAMWWDPVALIAALRDGDINGDQAKNASDDITKYVQYDQKKKDWYFTQEPSPAKDLPEMLTSSTPIDRETAYSMLLSTSIHFPEYGKDLDDACRAFITNFQQQKEEYDQCQKDHEANVT